MVDRRIQIREWRKLTWHDPAVRLRRLREIERQILDMDLSPEIRHLRTNELKPYREAREAALFAHGMSVVVGVKVLFALHEASDYDFVASHEHDDGRTFYPIQLKEWVPSGLNPQESLNDLLGNLAHKYTSPSSTTIAIHVNRPGKVEFAELDVPKLEFGGLWLFGATTEDQSKWALYGSLLHSPLLYEFEYPWP